MANNDLSNSEKILVKVDQNNLVYIDPNSVVENGEVQPRGVKQENLVMYVNLEADLIPRSTLLRDDEKNNLTSIAKGTLNFLSSNTDDKNLTTKWTNSYVTESVTENTKNFNQSDLTGESFGIDSVSIVVKGMNFVPQVNITFIDVRGKTLFESPENSPYKAFFHLPWPIFYLTVKGYYGKAIRYRLHLVKFNTKYNESNGNFEITTSFVGSTYAFMTDIPLKGVLNAPYMFMNEAEKNGVHNDKTGKVEKKVYKSSKGYSILNSVYDEMKRKKLIPQDFPVKTLREVGEIAETLDKILEQKIFDNVIDMRVLTGLQDYDKILTSFKTKLNNWAQKYLDKTNPIEDNSSRYYILAGDKKFDYTNITGSTSTTSLEGIVTSFSKQLKESALLNTEFQNTKSIKFESKFLTKSISNFSSYHKLDSLGIYVRMDDLLNDVTEMIKSFYEQKQKIEEEVERKMNEIVKDVTKGGIGFEPTVRNLFAIILANAEVYVRLLKEVHREAFSVAEDRKKLIFDTDKNKEAKQESIFPWPEIKKTTPTDKKKVIAYPGEPELRNLLKSDNPTLWPEVAFIEEYIGVATNKQDPLADKEGGVNTINYIFETDYDKSNVNEVSQLFNVGSILPYSDRSVVGFLYELYERSKILTLVDNFNSNTINELVKIEFDSISELIKGEGDLVDILRTSINSVDELMKLMETYSTFERLPYFKDGIPTQQYLKDLLNQPFNIEKYTKGVSKEAKNTSLYEKLNNDLLNYKSEKFRNEIYPFSSETYKTYVSGSTEVILNGILQVKPERGFICSTVSPYSWVKPEYKKNIFNNKLEFSGTTENIFNTPYFHKQLYNEFWKTSPNGKYVGSAYLLLNSLPFLDLDDKIKLPKSDSSVLIENQDMYPEILMANLFREQAATHYIPYHLILKWGSIYHRYKVNILEGKDILDGFITSGQTTNIDGSLFFNSGKTETEFTVFADGIKMIQNPIPIPILGLIPVQTGATYNSSVDVGIHPYYDAIFHQIINGYNHYNILSGNTSYYDNVTKGAIRTKKVETNGLRYWTSFVDNSKFLPTDLRYTLLPSDGDNNLRDFEIKNGTKFTTTDTFETATQSNFRTIWEDNYLTDQFSGYTYFQPDEYNKTINGSKFSLIGNKRKVLDLMGTFSPQILEQFEDLFLHFASEKLKEEIPFRKFDNIKYDNFQNLLSDLFSVEKQKSDDNKTTEEIINEIKDRQNLKLQNVSYEILRDENMLEIKLGNPKEYDSHIIEGFINIKGNTLKFNNFSTTNLENQKYITLYLGSDIDGYYLEFFTTNNIELTEENVLILRPLILIYAGYRNSRGEKSSETFKTYIRTNIFLPSNNRLIYYLTNLIFNFKKFKVEKETTRIDFIDGYNNRNLKIELYNFFKSFNDKWSSGNSIGQKLLMEEFLFLDKANKDIGDKVFLNLEKFVSIVSPKNDKASLYSALTQLIAGSGFDMRTLPAYVNFYGNNIQSSGKIMPSEKIASTVFGTYLEVDYQESSPKTIIQFIGPTSKHLADMSKNYKYNDDSFNIANTNNNPLIVTLPQIFDLDYLNKSNKVVAFEVSFGDENQSIFKGVSLDQSTIKNTSESFVVLENLARSESGAGTYNVDVGLFDYYRQASYSCEVTCMGNVMIQPTMYFYLKNIPMFRGSYWITEVSHSIKNNSIMTTFKGSRIPQTSLPNPEDSFMSSYKSLFDKIVQKAKVTVNSESKSTTEFSLKTDGGTFIVDLGSEIIKGEEIIPSSGITPFGVPYNGFNGEKYIQKVIYNGEEWLRSVVTRMGSSLYQISDDTMMSIVSRLPGNYNVKDSNGVPGVKWGELKKYQDKQMFYSTKFQLDNTKTPQRIITGKTIFLNPNKKDKPFELSPSYVLDRTNSTLVTQGPVNIGPSIDGSGIGMSEALMRKLDIHEGQVIYFKII